MGEDVTSCDDLLQTVLHPSSAEGKVYVERIQDVEPILKENQAAQSMPSPFRRRGAFHHVASIPFVVVEKWKNELGIDVFNPDHMSKVKELLNDSGYRKLRTNLGQL